MMSHSFQTPPRCPSSGGSSRVVSVKSMSSVSVSDDDYSSVDSWSPTPSPSNKSLQSTPPGVAVESPSFLRIRSYRNQIGTSWSMEISLFRQAGSVFEAVICLRSLRLLLETIDKEDRIKFCKADFEHAVSVLQKQKTLWSNDLFREVADIIKIYFNECQFNKLPTYVIQEIFLWLPIDDFAPILSVSREFYELGTSDEVWYQYYAYKFCRHDPNSKMPAFQSCNHMRSFKQRLADPQIGDHVEVAWRGKFRLESADVYHGLAWWVAEVVDKHTSQAKYKIRYPGWESRWDEWVPRNRLRWAVDFNTVTKIQVNDVVEVWCCGSNVPGAWLECVVKKISHNKYNVGKVRSSGPLWVERDRLRLIKHRSSSFETDDSTRSDSFPIRRLSSFFSSVSNSNNNSNQHRQSCSIM